MEYTLMPIEEFMTKLGKEMHIASESYYDMGFAKDSNILQTITGAREQGFKIYAVLTPVLPEEKTPRRRYTPEQGEYWDCGKMALEIPRKEGAVQFTNKFVKHFALDNGWGEIVNIEDKQYVVVEL